MRASLKWALGLSTAASALALLWPTGEPDTTQLPAPAATSSDTSRVASQDAHGARPFYSAASATQVKPLQATQRDPFATLQKALPPVAPVVVAPPPPPPPAPVAPPLGYRYFGSFTNPDGVREVYLSRADRAVPVKVGSQLEGGYMVESIQATTINVVHPATQTQVDIPIAQNKESP